MNFVFISPQFPKTYWNFCDRLKKNGANVLGIGDTPYDEIDWRLKECLTEYYYCPNLTDYEQAYKAVAFFAFKYGKIDWIESNNEFWLETDAKLRTDFNVTTGIQTDMIDFIKSKALMKIKYAEGNIPTARSHRVTDQPDLEAFIAEVGFPVIVKPDNGVGACDTWKLTKKADIKDFFQKKPDVPYVCEEFITGDIVSYDAINDSNGDPLFESMTEWPPSIADIVNLDLDLNYYVRQDVDPKLAELGRRAVKAFHGHNRFVHLEFFRLKKAKKGLGEVGDYVGLEVNMRPAGGYTPDMMNYAHSVDVYQIWADMVTTNQRLFPAAEVEQCCVYTGRKDHKNYVHSHEEILEKYGDKIVMCERMPEMMVPQMGNQNYTAKLANDKEVKKYVKFVQEQVKEK